MGCDTCDSDSPREEIATRYSGPSLITTKICVRVEKLLVISENPAMNLALACLRCLRRS